MFSNTLLVFTFTIIQCVNCCTFDEKNLRSYCESYEILKKSGPHPNAKKLNLYKENSELGPVTNGLFKKCENIQDLQVKGLANSIEANAWEGLTNLYELHLDDNKINIIKSNSFANLPIEVIYIYHCDVHELMPKAFDKVPKLRWVFMYGNNISVIEEGVFTDTDISHAILRKNGIQTVKPNAFGNMDNLQHLSLEENLLTSFAPQLVIGFAPKLTHLYINRNKLTKVGREMFTIMPNLQVLLLNINQIERFGDNVFVDLKKLSLLDISHNKLEELQVNIFNARGMKHLQILFIHDNNLSFLSSGVLIRLPILKKISVGGNPWQCPCWDMLDYYLIHHNVTKLCDDVYKEGKRPSCVYSDKAPKDCIYDVENVRDLSQIFQEQLQEYGSLPPVCNVDGVETPVLGA